ncbi:MAG: PDZ domain-containing protein [bacterium]
MRNMYALLVIIMGGVMGTTTTKAKEFYVSPVGKDANPGTITKPFATPARAQQAVRESASRGKEKIDVFLHGGTYYLAETLKFTADDSGTKAAPIVWQAYKDELPVISGGMKLELKWEAHKEGIVKAKVPAGLVTDQFFVNGERQHLARYPNFNAEERIFNGYAKDAISPERAARWTDPRGGFIHVMHKAMWGGMHYVITGKDDKNKLSYEGGWQNNRPMGMHGQFRFVENIMEELDAPGEWFLNTNSATLYFFPPDKGGSDGAKPMDLSKATFEVARLKHLVELNGSVEKPVRFLMFKGLTMRHTLRTFMETREPLLRSDWTVYRGGAVFYNGAEDCSLEDCFIDQVGGNAVFVNNYNRRVTIRGCHIAKAGGNGVAFIGDPNACQNAIFWNDRPNFNQISKIPGPKTSNYPADCLVDDCLIYLIGRVEKQTAGVTLDMAQSITIRHCSIYDMPRAGINFGDGCWGGHVIEFCDVFDTVKETGDHGSFNSWGRDRFWGLGGIDLHCVTTGENKDLPLLDMVKPVIIHDNRWRCDHGWDIDLDDGSSNYELRNNLCLGGGLKNREGFYRIVENNITVNNSFHPHVWYLNSQDVFRRNIVFTDYRPIQVEAPWGRECDFNLLHKPGQVEPVAAVSLQRQSGRDTNSIVADAMFVDPEIGDYRVKDGSPALKLGFKNFPMDNFGVQKPALKALARTPELPGSNGKKAATLESKRDGRIVEWLGAKIKNVTGLGEVSAAGLPGEVGIRVQAVSSGSAAEKAGLRANDVVLKCEGKEMTALADFMSTYAAVPTGTKIKLGIYRSGKSETLEIKK